MRITSPRPLCVQLLPETHAAGAENQARYLTQALYDSQDFEVELAHFEAGRAHAAFEEIGVPLRRFERRHRFRFDLPLRSRRIRHAYANRPPDILHTWLVEGNLFGLIAARAWPKTGLIITQRGSWNELDYPHHLRLQRLLKARADHAISNSAGGAQLLERLGIDPGRISVIPNGLPVKRVEVGEARSILRRRLGWEEHEVIAWVGRAEDPPAMAQKGFGTLLAAAGRVHAARPGVRLALIGLTAEEVHAAGFELPAWANALGWLERAPDHLNAADALVISSRTEGHSNVAAEALLLGLPVATTACGGHCAVVERAGGRVTPVGDHRALADAIADLLTKPPEAARVRKVASEELSVDRMVQRTISVYERVLAEKSDSGSSSG